MRDADEYLASVKASIVMADQILHWTVLHEPMTMADVLAAVASEAANEAATEETNM